MLPQLQMVGRLTANPELKTTQNGANVCNITLACNDRQGEGNFFDCTVWGKTAEVLCQYKGKGDLLFAVGEVQQQTWNDKETGVKRSKLIFNINSIDITLSPKKDGTAPTSPVEQPVLPDIPEVANTPAPAQPQQNIFSN